MSKKNSKSKVIAMPKNSQPAEVNTIAAVEKTESTAPATNTPAFKITSKTSKRDLLDIITANLTVKGVDKMCDAATISTAGYAISNPDKATRTDLANLVKTMLNSLGDKFITHVATPVAAESKPETSGETSEPKTENLVKKSTSTSKTKDATKSTTKSKAKTEKSDELAPADEPKKTKAKTSPSAEDTMVPLATAKTFPEKLTIGGVEFTKVTGEITLTTIRENIENGAEYEFAFLWTKRHLKQFAYFGDQMGHPKSFPNDLDTAQLIYVSEQDRVAYAISDATEVPYTILPHDLPEVDGVRVTAGIEFSIYEAITSETDDEDEEDLDEDEDDEGDAE